LKEIEEDHKGWKDLLCSLLCRIKVVKMAILLKAIYVFKTIHIKISIHPSQRLKNLSLTFIWKHKRLGIFKAILSKKSNAGGVTIPDFKLYYRAIAIKAAWYWHKNR
jgi:hypothetical protein